MTASKFTPKPGQTDFTHIRYAPVLNVIAAHAGKILMVRRSPDLAFYPEYWHCVAGFLDDQQSIEEKTREELREELGWHDSEYQILARGSVHIDEAPRYGKTYLVVPILVESRTSGVTLDWEASQAQWFAPADIKKLKLLPGFLETVAQFFPEVL
jgi:ADP-ribose pyrophosphatase YjhB (NUDIX family)